MTDLEKTAGSSGEASGLSSRPLSEAYTQHDHLSQKSKEGAASEAEEGIEEAFEPAKDEEVGFHQNGGHHLQADEPDPNIVGWDGPDDPENPQNWSNARKWWISICTAGLTFVVSFGSSVFSTATAVTAEEFGVSEEVMILGVTLYVVGFACGKYRFGRGAEAVADKVTRPIGVGSTIRGLRSSQSAYGGNVWVVRTILLQVRCI